MTQSQPQADCCRISFPAPCTLEPQAQVALEDYARVLTGASSAEVIERSGETVGLHLCGLAAPVAEGTAADIVAFTRELLSTLPGGGLGWS